MTVVSSKLCHWSSSGGTASLPAWSAVHSDTVCSNLAYSRNLRSSGAAYDPALLARPSSYGVFFRTSARSLEPAVTRVGSSFQYRPLQVIIVSAETRNKKQNETNMITLKTSTLREASRKLIRNSPSGSWGWGQNKKISNLNRHQLNGY